MIVNDFGLRKISFFWTNESPFFIVSLFAGLNNIFDCIPNQARTAGD